MKNQRRMIQANVKDKLPLKEEAVQSQYKCQFKHSKMKNIGKVHLKKKMWYKGLKHCTPINCRKSF